MFCPVDAAAMSSPVSESQAVILKNISQRPSSGPLTSSHYSQSLPVNACVETGVLPVTFHHVKVKPNWQESHEKLLLVRPSGGSAQILLGRWPSPPSCV